MNTDLKNIKVPLVLFLDDGVHVFGSIVDAEQSQESIDVRNNPSWFGYGYDSSGNGLRLDVFTYERKVLGFSLKEEGVKLRIDESVSLDSTSNTTIDQMREYLFGIDAEGDEKEVPQFSAKDMLNQIFEKAAAK
jgi:hypothetical protein